jgi:isopentenyl diphosphate isomerase/L-lactate dehydrogenase-like FMN-dependent dehydrogenase
MAGRKIVRRHGQHANERPKITLTHAEHILLQRAAEKAEKNMSDYCRELLVPIALKEKGFWTIEEFAEALAKEDDPVFVMSLER